VRAPSSDEKVQRLFRDPKGRTVSLWLLLIIAGLVLLVLGLAGLGQFFIYLGLIVAVVGVVLVVVGRGNRPVGR
jgi:uncharacterized membrane protein HdeD (DUF308 family)